METSSTLVLSFFFHLNEHESKRVDGFFEWSVIQMVLFAQTYGDGNIIYTLALSIEKEKWHNEILNKILGNHKEKGRKKEKENVKSVREF